MFFAVACRGCDSGASESASAGEPSLVVTFRGFEKPRYQQHDRLIVELVEDFNANKLEYAGATAKQADAIPDLTPQLVKAWIIQETGGQDPVSLEAWKLDPAQMNVPDDWSPAKRRVGLKMPGVRNTGGVRSNLKAAIAFLSRKGFSRSAQPASANDGGAFSSWREALARYNGREQITADELPYRAHYAERIIRRANNPDEHAPISLPQGVEGE